VSSITKTKKQTGTGGGRATLLAKWEVAKPPLFILGLLYNIGQPPEYTNEKLLMHPVLSFSLLVVWMATTIAIITALCGVRSRKRSSPSCYFGCFKQFISDTPRNQKRNENTRFILGLLFPSPRSKQHCGTIFEHQTKKE
jgi:hypothetical protein